MKRAYYSALSQPLTGLEPAERVELPNGVAFINDLTTGVWPIEFASCEVIYAEMPWRPGLGDLCTVHSFDHVAVNDSVTACDIADVPIDDGELDVAVFCLSLMGANYTDYLKEAHRTLKLDGRLHIYEATSGFTDREQFAADLKTLGFGQVSIEDEWKFTHIIASKDRLNPRRPVEKLGGL